MKQYTEDSPYGYWIGKDEIIPVVNEECHWETAVEVVLKREPKQTSVYGVMYRLGYIRVVNYRSGGYGVSHSKHATLSRLQKQFLQDATDIESDR